MFMEGACQGVSILFLLWAIIRLYKASGRSLTLRELSTQTMMVIHITTLSIYLASMMVYYIVYSVWDENNAKAENKVYISFTVSAILLFLV